MRSATSASLVGLVGQEPITQAAELGPRDLCSFTCFTLWPSSGPRENYRGPWGDAKQGNALEEALPKEKVVSGVVHWETHDTRIALCKYAGIVLFRIS